MRTAIFLVAIFCLTSCACVHKPSAAPYDNVHGGPGVTIEFLRGTYTKAGRYDLYLRFTNREDYDGLVQELTLESGETLVEVFIVPKGGWVIDHHAGEGWRRMKIYPACFVGVKLDNGWGELPANQSYTVTSTTGASFNPGHPMPRTGIITRQAIEDFSSWHLTPRDGGVEVWTPSSIENIKPQK